MPTLPSVDLGEIAEALGQASGAFTPERYGAVGNGVDDDTTAVAAALDAAAAVNGQVAFGAAAYRITGNLTVDTDNVTLAGAGKGTKLVFVK